MTDITNPLNKYLNEILAEKQDGNNHDKKIDDLIPNKSNSNSVQNNNDKKLIIDDMKINKKKESMKNNTFLKPITLYTIIGVIVVILLILLYSLFTRPKLEKYAYIERFDRFRIIHTSLNCSKIRNGVMPYEVNELKKYSGNLFCSKCTNKSIIEEITGKKLSFISNNSYLTFSCHE